MTETEFLGARQVRRSAHAVTTGTATSVYLGQCGTCPRPVRAEFPGLGARTHTFPCPDCGTAVTAERLVAKVTSLVCDGSCMGAWGPHCECGCGGVNHGRSWGAKLSSGLVPESALERYRKARERLERQRQARRDRAAQARAAEFAEFLTENQELVARLEAEEVGYGARFPNGFLEDMQRLVREERPLTPNMVGAVARTLESRRQGREREAAREAERERRQAAGYRVPTGRVEVVGVVTWTEEEDGDWGLRTVMTVDTGQYRVRGTAPRDLLGGHYIAERNEDGSPAKWGHEEPVGRGDKVAFSATLAPSTKDPTFGWFKRPAKARFLERKPEQEVVSK